MNELVILQTSILDWTIGLILLWLIASGVSAMWKKATEKKKTKDYREDLTNLYVAGKIKNIAEKDNVDLDKELKEFRKFEKLMNCKYKELDNVIEEEMKESIQKDFEEARHN
ncbi:MAG: hypothetical protein M0R17_05840 [Candidatus Omnitrophica bacterium]|jgi:hypothetical protein|nr:hypothetical protein [Candidatus Omnitrophota bacterium]